jgi:hypothetical protein
VRKPKEIRPTGRPQNRWGNDIKRAKEIGWNNLRWNFMVRWQTISDSFDRVKNFWFCYNAGECFDWFIDY